MKIFYRKLCVRSMAFILVLLTTCPAFAQESDPMKKQLALVHDLLLQMHKIPAKPPQAVMPVVQTVLPEKNIRPLVVQKPSVIMLHPGRTAISLATRPGLEIGIQTSKYEYHEVVGGSPFMNTKGYKAGVEAVYTRVIDDHWFLRGDGRFAYGEVDYSGSGSSHGNPDYTWEASGVIGRDFILDSFSLSPYAGYGYRYLFNDARGITSTGQFGYRRESRYQYIPVGLTHRAALTDQARIATNLEYDYFIKGSQKSFLGDVNPVIDTLENKQQHAYGGTRGSVSYETADWSFGPWFNYWNIRNSKVNCVPGFCGMEPKNETTEFGLRISRKIF